MDLDAMLETCDDKVLGIGGCGDIRVGVLDGMDVVIKRENAEVEVIKNTGLGLIREAKLYPYVKGEVGFPEVIAGDIKGSGEGSSYLVLERLGMSLKLLHHFSGTHFSLKTILMIADQLLARLEVLHDKGIIHGDLQPSNVLIGYRHEAEGVLHLIDFGFSELHTSDATDIRSFGFVGTQLYASTTRHLGSPDTRGSELMSLYYVLIYMVQSTMVDWPEAPNGEEVPSEHVEGVGRVFWPDTYEAKIQHGGIDLPCAIPEAFQQLRTYAQELMKGGDERPDYSYLRRLFRELFFCKGYSMDGEFDWTPTLRELDENDDAQYRQFQEGRKSADARREAAAATTEEDGEGGDDRCVAGRLARSGSGMMAGKNAALMTEEQKRLYEESFGVVYVSRRHHEAFPRDPSMCDVERIWELKEVREHGLTAEMMEDVDTEIQKLSENLEQRRLRREQRESLALKELLDLAEVSGLPEIEEFLEQQTARLRDQERGEMDPEERDKMLHVVWRYLLLK